MAKYKDNKKVQDILQKLQKKFGGGMGGAGGFPGGPGGFPGGPGGFPSSGGAGAGSGSSGGGVPEQPDIDWN